MTDELENLGDAQLSEVFAVEVAGWTRGNPPRGDMPWYNGPVTRKGGHMGHPPFATSADAVLPWLETHPSFPEVRHPLKWDNVKRGNFDPTHGREWEVVILPNENFKFQPIGGRAPTFARAACIALIRAKRPTTRNPA